MSKAENQHKYDPASIEPKWQAYWAENKTFDAIEDASKPKYYVLSMFPYPSVQGFTLGTRSATPRSISSRAISE